MKYFIAIFIFLFSAMPVLAAPQGLLADIYWSRPDLHSSFEPERLRAIPGTNAGFLVDLQDWAEQYGWREYSDLSSYRPDSSFIPKQKDSFVYNEIPEVTAENYIIIDKSSKQILAARNADREWPMASITKLMTSEVVLDKGVNATEAFAVKNIDNVGGARLYVEDGELFTIDDLFYATLVGSANNAANALARSTGYSSDTFIRAMNGRADNLNLSRTKFVDPTGIELGNVSTARETAFMANWVFRRPEVRHYTSTWQKYIHDQTTDEDKRIRSTNWMLYYPEYDDVYVMSGKTGYLNESRWNLVVSLRKDYEDPDTELLMVLFGAASRPELFQDAKALAEWAWENYDWLPNSSI